MAEGPEGLHIDERRLAAILAADVAGYSRLMGRNEEETVRDLEAHQAVILPLIAKHGGAARASRGARRHLHFVDRARRDLRQARPAVERYRRKDAQEHRSACPRLPDPVPGRAFAPRLAREGHASISPPRSRSWACRPPRRYCGGRRVAALAP